MHEITRMLAAMQQGDDSAAEALLSEVYHELRSLAAAKMANERADHTLQPTALVHEAWMRLVGNSNVDWQNRAHFFGAAGEAMRRILVESARRKKRQKRGSNPERVSLDSIQLPSPMRDDDLLALDEALNRLASVDSRASELVKLCFFVGLTQEQAATELNVSVSTVERTWAYAKAWLFREMKNSSS